MTTCQQCGIPTKLMRSGARYCSTACRMRAYRARKRTTQAFPEAMTARRRWVRRTASKRPLTVDGWPASVTASEDWSTFSEALDSTAGVGMGFVLGDGIGCVDLDHCFDADGQLAGWAAEAIDAISEPIIFAEVSQSGDGLHVFIEADEAKGSKIRDGRNIERYSRGRYIAVTGKTYAID